MTIGWYVRVTTTEIVDGERVTTLYVVGCATPQEAEEAVRLERSLPGETYEALEGEVLEGVGPQPKPGQVRHLVGAN